MARRKPRIGILTGGGDCPGLNAVIRSVVKCAAFMHGAEVLGIEYGFKGLIEEGFTRPLDGAAIRGILPRGGTVLGTTNRGNPFAYVDSWGGEPRDLSDRCARSVERLGLDAVIAVGGDGTLGIAHKLAKKGVPMIGVPKTIDGDVTGTDRTVGFHTARSICTEAIDRLHTTAEAHDRVMVLEVMGRESGFLALESAIAGGADVVLIPEILYQIHPVVREIQERTRRGMHFSIVVVSEGAAPSGGGVTVQQAAGEGRSEVRLGGAGKVVADALTRALGGAMAMEVRYTNLGHLPRGGTPTPEDRVIGTRFGVAAVNLAVKGDVDRATVIRGGEVLDVPLEETSTRRKLDPGGQLVHVARSLGISFGEVEEAK